MKYPLWGRVSAPAGVAPEALEECEHLSKGYEYRACVVDRVTQPFNIRFSRFRHSFQLIRRPLPSLDQFKRLIVRARRLVRHVGFYNRAVADLVRGYDLSHGVRGALEP